MPTNNPTGYETYIYDHKQYPGSNSESRQHRGPLHNPDSLPEPKSDNDSSPLIMIEPSYAYQSYDVFIHFRHGTSIMLNRNIAEQLRDALTKVCQKPTQQQTQFKQTTCCHCNQLCSGDTTDDDGIICDNPDQCKG